MTGRVATLAPLLGAICALASARAGAQQGGATPPKSEPPPAAAPSEPAAPAPGSEAPTQPGPTPATATPPVAPSPDGTTPTNPAQPAPTPPAPAEADANEKPPASPTPEAAGTASPPAPSGPGLLSSDTLAGAGYIPGYKPLAPLGMPPYSPRTSSLPGGVTPGYGAPLPSDKWNFSWTGFMTISLQSSLNQRPVTAADQHKTVFHVPPQTVDEYASFVGTSTTPGQWVQMNFAYGNSHVTANVQLTTWNPSDPSTYYQIGGQQFVNSAYLAFAKVPVGPAGLRAQVGYFNQNYGGLGQYGLGMYTNPTVALIRGVGENLILDYELSDTTTIALEDGFMGSRGGARPINLVGSGQNGGQTITEPAAWIHHAHLGIERKGDLLLRAKLHYVQSWAQDDRVQRELDNPQTHQLPESYMKDSRLNVYGADVAIGSPVYGYLGIGGSYVRGRNAAPMRGVSTFGGDSVDLTQRWWGQPTGGTGTLSVIGVNYSASLAKIVSYPTPFNNDGPDVAVNAGFVFAKASTDFKAFDRSRHKFGLDVLYTFLPYMGAGVRFDRVVPTSNDSEETFHVLAPRLVFRTGWSSHEQITLLYAKWFYGSHTHAEQSSVTQTDRRDDQLVALNFNLWW